MDKNDKDIYIIIHNIRSAHNVGSILRTADAAGVSGVYMSGYTPTPLDRFGRERKDIAKTALGAEKNVFWKYYKTPKEIIEKLKRRGCTIVGIEQSKNSADYKTVCLRDKVVFIIGNEVRGISKNLLDVCDVVAEINMGGKKESLNVAVATGVAIFRILDI